MQSVLNFDVIQEFMRKEAASSRVSSKRGRSNTAHKHKARLKRGEAPGGELGQTYGKIPRNCISRTSTLNLLTGDSAMAAHRRPACRTSCHQLCHSATGGAFRAPRC
ncbi:hypothetical protein E2C01_026309 [Portunus trituberculatus]|uniref:Uncharacterized protein n=1 Tax=Portunus trituberculatus TaxID=210409 RepID=A0A5B7EFC0_PORTR|nr:hypothetical protein [Portunus trituberculatus]